MGRLVHSKTFYTKKNKKEKLKKLTVHSHLFPDQFNNVEEKR